MRPSEGLTHWYTRYGTPCYTVIGRNGKERPTTLRDARQLDLVPSVTTIIKCAAAPALEHWKSEQVLLAALTLPRRPHETEKSWIDRVWFDSREQARKAAERGTAIHAAIQGHYEGEPPHESLWEYVAGAADVIADECPGETWVAEASFCHELGYGGKSDLHNPRIVLDIKTKEFDDPATLATYDEHAMQLGAYREGLKAPDARGGILYVSSIVPGLAKLLWVDEIDLRRGWRMFQSLLYYWKAKNKIVPA